VNELTGFLADALIGMAVLVALAWLLLRVARAVALSFRPLSGDLTDSAVYHRSLFTLRTPDVQIAWVALACGALGYALSQAGSAQWLWLAAAGLLAAVGWDLWTWERAAASTRMVSWRRGWRRSTRQVPISRIRELHMVERPAARWLGPLAGPLGHCYIALQLREGGVAKLARTSVLASRGPVEDLANYVRLQMASVEEERARKRNDKRREAIAELTPVDIAIRMRLKALRTSPGGADEEADGGGIVEDDQPAARSGLAP
jgi:hypothetical protein